MKIFCLISLIAAVALLSAACSTLTDLVIVNQSDKPLTIRREFNSLNSRATATASASQPAAFPAPLIADRARYESNDFEWRELPPEQFGYDAENQTLTAVIEPNTIFLLGHDSYNSPETDQPGKNFDIKRLTLSGANGSIAFEGANIYKQFERKTSGWWSRKGDYYAVRYR